MPGSVHKTAQLLLEPYRRTLPPALGHLPTLFWTSARPATLHFPQRAFDCRRQWHRAATSETHIHILKTADQVNQLAPRIRPSSRRAKMRAASEGTAFINQTLPRLIEHRAATVFRCRQFCAPRCTQSLRRDQRLALCQIRRQSGKFKMTALRPPDAVALHGTLSQRGIDSPHLGKGFLFVT